MITRIPQIIFSVGSLLLSSLLFAAEYDVELIVFAQKHARPFSELHSAGSLPPLQASPHDPRLKHLEPTARLQAEAARLASNGPYELLLRAAWRQPGLDRQQAFFIDAGDLDAGSRQKGLSGRVRLILSRYLHLETDLRYNGSAEVEDSVYQIHETRLLRSGELNYLDHPAFGVLVRVSPHRQEENTSPLPAEDGTTDE